MNNKNKNKIKQIYFQCRGLLDFDQIEFSSNRT